MTKPVFDDKSFPDYFEKLLKNGARADEAAEDRLAKENPSLMRLLEMVKRYNKDA